MLPEQPLRQSNVGPYPMKFPADTVLALQRPPVVEFLLQATRWVNRTYDYSNYDMKSRHSVSDSTSTHVIIFMHIHVWCSTHHAELDDSSGYKTVDLYNYNFLFIKTPLLYRGIMQ